LPSVVCKATRFNAANQLARIVHFIAAMRVFLLAVILAAFCARASAGPLTTPTAASTSTPQSSDIPEPRFAIALNSPLAWTIGWFGASAYMRLGDHVALRANVATYRYGGPGGVIGGLASAFNDGGTGYGGRILDVGIAGVLYPRRPWDGPLLEVGVLRRGRDVYMWPEFDPRVTTRSTTYAGRALVGWSWLFGPHMFIAVAAGLSVGREAGRETTMPDYGDATTKPLRRRQIDGESYLRFGVAFGH
jgi:hypothetical protein